MPENFIPELLGLSVFVFAAVEQIKQFGAKGKLLTVLAFVVGLIFGVLYRYASVPMTDFNSWFLAITFGLMSGMMATGAYDGAKRIAAASVK